MSNFERFRFINNRQMDRGQNDFLLDVLQTINRYLNCGKLILYIYLNIICIRMYNYTYTLTIYNISYYVIHVYIIYR